MSEENKSTTAGAQHFVLPPTKDSSFAQTQNDICQSPIRPSMESIFASPFKDFFMSPTRNPTDHKSTTKLRCDDDLLFTPERPTRNSNFDLELSPLPEANMRHMFQSDTHHSKSLLSPLRSPFNLRTPQRLSPGLHPFPSPMPSPSKDLTPLRPHENENENDVKILPPGTVHSEADQVSADIQSQRIWATQSLPFAFDRAPQSPSQQNATREQTGPRTLQSTLENGSSQLSSSSQDKKCNCKNSKCLKLYCICFSTQKLCKDCSCQDCLNTEATFDKVIEARSAKMNSDPSTFHPKIIAHKHQRGCHCKKGCQKKYCECFSAGVSCGVSCKCMNCLNQIVVKATHMDDQMSSPQPDMYSQGYPVSYHHHHETAASRTSGYAPEPLPLPDSIAHHTASLVIRKREAFSSPTRAAAKRRALEMQHTSRAHSEFCVITSPVEKDMALLRMHRRSLEPSTSTQQYGGLITVASVPHVRDKPPTPTWRTAIGVKRISTTFA